ncbi:sulfite exporter TauE/SafE family protein [Nocardioides sp. SR21]|uniref:sulfite exporter TauE/SafE family protein n=1 Tax=Nocardioides sp. SR21 TaxID=2919501 RepID=UPI001FAA837B|nr:sulfite exporter TauE/SafE family protein [Nocardioides sp. SR21]
MRKLILLALVGLAAQLVDGSLGMGYGVTSATLLVAGGLGPAAASAAVHFSEIGTSLVSGISHQALGNVDWRTVGILAAPGFVGAFAGATFLVSLDGEIARVLVASILLVLGGYVTWRFLVPQRLQFKGRPSARFLAPVGLLGGALDAVGGGGWGPIGTTSMLSSGRLEPRKVVGSVDTAEFVVTVGASLGFLAALGSQGIDWRVAGALLVGGVIAAPIAAVLVRLLPARILGVTAGGLIVLTNMRTLGLELGVPGLTIALLASVVFTVWVLWISWAIKLDRAEREGGTDRPGDVVAAKVN